MAEDWASDVKIYSPDADDGVIAAIVRYCGIALQSTDGSLVSFSDPAETDRVRENYLKKKLALTDSDAALDAAIAAVGQRMNGDRTRNRVTVYYLLAEHFGRSGVFGADAGIAAAATRSTAPLAFAAIPPVATAGDHDHRGVAVTGWGDYVPLAVLVVGGALLLSYLGRPEPVIVAEAIVPVAAPLATGVPEGAGLVSENVDGKPFVSVYFETAKTDVTPEIAPAAAALKAYVDSHPGSTLAVSGYNDPRGDAAMNAELSKNRAIAVRTVLVRSGLPEAAVTLEKPAETTDAGTTLTNARRVDVRVIDTLIGTAPGAAPPAAPSPQ
ncbi:DUF2853 family protein [Polymorphobacter fuscus]|uniref:DUF2853 family protein n=1 Tax=Sandarakinorhabdus fusca TaxID=1439888 RepID=UPI00142FE1BA|nr:DUF2853 family protein [Polymorphobacter fuscus]NJC08440.1 hypothetical protein [Polymorphobacter fuscus]